MYRTWKSAVGKTSLSIQPRQTLNTLSNNHTVCRKQGKHQIPRKAHTHIPERSTRKMDAADEFPAYYLQRATKELAEDLDKVRDARDFKSDSVHVLVHAIQQGFASFPGPEREKVAVANKPANSLTS